MTMDEETRERIEKEAVAFAAIILGEPPVGMDDTIVTGYKAGAVAEHSRITELLKEERVKAIDECWRHLEKIDPWLLSEDELRKEIMSLKK